MWGKWKEKILIDVSMNKVVFTDSGIASVYYIFIDTLLLSF